MPEDQRNSSEPPAPPGNQRRKTIWQEASKRLLQAEMARHGYTYKSLARALGGAETDQSLMTRVNRGTFSLAFFLQALRVMGSNSVDISHLPSGQGTGGRTKRS